MFEEEMTQIEEKADIKRKVLEKERERIKSMEKRSLHYVQQKIHEKTSWIDERKSKVGQIQSMMYQLTSYDHNLYIKISAGWGVCGEATDHAGSRN